VVFVQVSLARHLSAAGFDTWILEVRGAGLSKREGEPTSSELGGSDGALTGAVQDAFVRATLKSATNQASKNANSTIENNAKKQGVMMSDSKEVALNGNKTPVEEETAASRLTSTIVQISERLRGLVSEGQSRILSARFIEQVVISHLMIPVTSGMYLINHLLEPYELTLGWAFLLLLFETMYTKLFLILLSAFHAQ
jgi:hypothetical protein